MKKEQKLILAVFSACVVIFFGYWTWSGLYSSAGSNVSQNNAENSVSATQGGSIPSQFSYLDSNSQSSPAPAKNMTQTLAADMSSEFISHSQTASTSTVDDYLKGVGSSQDLNQKLVSISKDSMTDFIQDFPIPAVNIINNASSQDYETYWKSYNDAFKNQISIFNSDPSVLTTALNNAVQKNDFTQLDQMLSDYSNAMASLKSMKVPSDLISFQSKNISFLNNYIAMMKSIENVNTDPLKAYYVTQNGFPIIQQQADSLATVYKSLKVRYNL